MTHPTTITAEPGLPFIDVVREFDAPAAAVFRAHTDANLYAQWLGGGKLDVVELDAKTGGRWKYVSVARATSCSVFLACTTPSAHQADHPDL